MSNSGLNAAKAKKYDEFYTRRQDIEAELRFYRDEFAGKTVYCNCDDPWESEFVQYFCRNFRELGLRKLMATHYEPNKENHSYSISIDGDSDGDGEVTVADLVKTELVCNGDFRSRECIELLDEADIVVTNPPFSLFREYMAQLIEHDKKFLIIGNKTACKAKEIFPYIKDEKVWLGRSIHSGGMWMRLPKGTIAESKNAREEDGFTIVNVAGVRWFTNLKSVQHQGGVSLEGNYYSPDQNPKYLNYDAIDVESVNKIPCDYEGEMGVPISIFDKLDTDQFELVGIIAGEKLNAQEGRNAVYHGPFVSDARRLFSKSNCPATKNDWDKLMKGSPIRQDYLETVLKWKAAEEGKSIEQYMSAHAQDEDAGFLFEYYERVMNWVYSVFPKNYYRREMQGVDWGLLYHKFHQQYYDAKEMEERVAKLMANDEVKNKKGIYTFVFDGDESSLNLRQFSASEKRVLYERCGGFCKRCGPKIHYKIEEMEADHIKPWSDGGKTELDNGQMLCKHHNRVKGNK